MNKRAKIIISAVGVILLLLFIIFVWPTRYRYDRLQSWPVRIDRITGKTEILYEDGWKNAGSAGEGDKITPEMLEGFGEQQAAPTPQDEELPRSEIFKLAGQSQIIDNSLRCNIYNGSDWMVNEVTVEIIVKNSDGSNVLSRKYRLNRYNYCEPLKSVEFYANVGFTLERGQTWSWQIVGAKGRKDIRGAQPSPTPADSGEIKSILTPGGNQ
ncbi:MAG: hypothetical protein M1536_01980 [Firmicutes bacterium]|nr:hypothetical protein [Bacillota bacterium]